MDETFVAHGALEVGLATVGYDVSIQVLQNKRAYHMDLVTAFISLTTQKL